MMRKRRKNGEGTFYKEKESGRYVWRGWITNEFGEKIRKKITSKDIELLVEEVKEFLSSNRKHKPKLNITVDEFITRFLDAEKTTLKPKTWLNYRQKLKTFISPRFGQQPMKNMAEQPYLIQEYCNQLLKRYSLGTVLTIRRVLSTFFSAALRNGIIKGANPISLTKAPKGKRRKIMLIEKDKLHNLIFAARSRIYKTKTVSEFYYAYCWYIFIWLSCNLATRWSETAAIQWSNCHLNKVDGFINICQSLTIDFNGHPVMGETKSLAGNRRILITPKMVHKLKIYRRIQERYRAEIHELYIDDTGLLFTTKFGGYVSLTNYTRRVLHPLFKECNITDATHHTIRHSILSAMVAEGVDLASVAKFAGHEDVQVLVRNYLHAFTSQDRVIISKIQKLNF